MIQYLYTPEEVTIQTRADELTPGTVFIGNDRRRNTFILIASSSTASTTLLTTHVASHGPSSRSEWHVPADTTFEVIPAPAPTPEEAR